MDTNRWEIYGYEDEEGCTEGRRKIETENRKSAEVKMNRVKNLYISLWEGGGSA
jgi:hypothetical protein